MRVGMEGVEQGNEASPVVPPAACSSEVVVWDAGGVVLVVARDGVANGGGAYGAPPGAVEGWGTHRSGHMGWGGPQGWTRWVEGHMGPEVERQHHGVLGGGRPPSPLPPPHVIVVLITLNA